MKILVAGGAGFIGSHVVDAYIKLGHKVSVIDDLSTGFRRNVNTKAKFYKADIRDLGALETIFKKEKPDVVNHHAAIAEVVKSLKDPIPTMEVNVIGTTNVSLLSGKYGIKKLIFSSTGGAIYGKPEEIPADEITSKTPLSPYGLSKSLGEEVIDFYSRSHGFTYLIFRYPNVYGPRQNPKGEAGVVAIFGGLMREGKIPTIFGDGTKTRDYLYVGDLVRANTLALRKGKNDIINLGWGREISDQKVYDTVAQALKFSKKPLYAPFREGEVLRTALDARKAQKVLGWKPRIKLEEGIRRTVE